MVSYTFHLESKEVNDSHYLCKIKLLIAQFEPVPCVDIKF